MGRESPYERPRLDFRRRRYNPFLIFGIALGAVLSFYLLLVVASHLQGVFLEGKEINLVNLPGVQNDDHPDVADIEQRVNILVLGLDQRRDDPPDQPYRTDTVFILTVDPYAKTGGILSIPRDLLVEIPDGYGGYTRDRINVAYELGQYSYQNYPGGGAGLAEDTIKHNFDIPIDYYVVVNFNNFIDLIDELGGIDVDIPEYAFDPAYTDCSRCDDYYPVEFVPGREHMDGERALAYARIRHSDNDFKRIERQQRVIEATVNKALEKKLLLPDEAVRLYKRYKAAIKTDIGDFKIPNLALLAMDIDLRNLQMVSLADATEPCFNCPAAVLLPIPDKVSELKARVFGDARLLAEAATIEVQNGTDVPDLAEQFTSFLKGQGLADERLTANELINGPLYNSTFIVDITGKSYTAKALADWLGLPQARIKAATDPEAQPLLNLSQDIVVVLGADAGLPKSASAGSGG